ncbi:acetate--CoA ligase family protein [bacterium]|nr:acetate--CoA ligase family protein [bacterium]
MKDFNVSKFYTYEGPNYYLNRAAIVFNMALAPDGKNVDHYKPEVFEKFPVLKDKKNDRVAELFAEAVIQVLKMDINLFINNYAISTDGDDYVIAVEYLDQYIAEDCIDFVSDWFNAMNFGNKFDFDEKFLKLQADFDKTLFGGPTLYSLIEAGLKRDIPVHYLFEENQFQWGYGRKQVRGRSTTFHVDGIKDTEFTMYKDMVADFLMLCGFPTPVGTNTYSEEEALAEAKKLGFPVVVKPVAGHKGQGVTTGIESEIEVRKAFNNILEYSKKEGIKFEGALVQQQIYGTDHRLLSVKGKFVAALERVPAYADGNGKDTIEKLIEIDNATEIRLDNARSPLCKIKIDEDLIDYLKLQNLSLDYIPKEGERITLRRVANISQGGVSINVTDKIHPKNIEMVENISKFLSMTCLGIDVLAADISKPWNEGNFGIIEINAGPGVFMHLAPAIGSSIDVPGEIMNSHFPTSALSRIPIISGNNISDKFCEKLNGHLKNIDPKMELGSLTETGVHFNGNYFHKNESHKQNVKIILRYPRLDLAVFNHTEDDIFDHGTFHIGSDITILENPHYAHDALKRDLFSDGFLVEVRERMVTVTQGEKELNSYEFKNPDEKDDAVLNAVKPLIETIINKYK